MKEFITRKFFNLAWGSGRRFLGENTVIFGSSAGRGEGKSVPGKGNSMSKEHSSKKEARVVGTAHILFDPSTEYSVDLKLEREFWVRFYSPDTM